MEKGGETIELWWAPDLVATDAIQIFGAICEVSIMSEMTLQVRVTRGRPMLYPQPHTYIACMVVTKIQ